MTANVNVTKVLFKRGNTVQNAAYTGINGEITVDTQAKTLRIHDGVTTGGNVIVAGGVVGSYSNTNAAAYIPTDSTITAIQSNITAANAAITALQSNASTQQTQINLLNANVTAANALIPNLLAISSNIIPSANVTYSLGSSTRQWKDLWVSNNTIYIGNVPITVSNGNLLVNGNLVTGSGGSGTDDVLRANVGAYQIFANANAATQATSINTFNANLGAYQTFANANAATQATSINTFNANLGAYQTFANSNAATQSTSINTFNANLGAYQTFANSNAATQSTAIATLQTQVYANANVNTYLSSSVIGSLSTSGNLTVGGNLVVNGNSTIINTTSYTIEDNILQIADANPADTLDLGFVGHRTVAGNLQHTGLVRDASAGNWRLFSNVTAQPGNTVDFTNAVYDDLVVGNISANIVKNNYTWAFGTNGTTTLPTVLAGDTSIGTAFNTNPPGHTVTLKHNGGVSGGSGGELKFDYGNAQIKVVKDAGTTQTWTFGTDGTTQFPGSKILAPVSESITMQSDQYSQLMWENANLTVAPNMAINSNFYVSQNNATLDIAKRDGSGTQVTKSWYWNADGSLTLPGEIILPNGAAIRDTAGDAVVFGQGAGETSQGTGAVAIGLFAGRISQGAEAVAIGDDAGKTDQGVAAVAVGYGAGYTEQGIDAVAVGDAAGYATQGNNAIAIGASAGTNTQGANAVAIGFGAGYLNQGNNSIIINATGSALNQITANTFTVAPIREATGNVGVLQYNATTKEVTYSNTISIAGNINANQYNFANGVNILSTVGAGAYGNTQVASYLSVFDGNILPSANVTYSLGSETRQWRDLWVSNNTIYIGNTPIRVDGGTLLVNGAPVGSNISTSFDLEMHVSKDGNDSTGTGTILRPYLTITYALTQVTGDRNTIVIHPGGYTENPTITSLATQLITYDATGASTLVYGTVTIANTTGRIAGLKMTNLAITGNAQAYINSSTVDEQFTKSSSGYVEVDDCELQTTGNVLISGSGIITIIGNKINNLVVNNAGASVLIKGANDCLMPQVTAGTLNIVDSIIRASSNTANAVTASAGTVVTLMNNQIVTPASDTVARVSIAGYHSIISVVYDKANSTLSNSLNSVVYFQTANVDSLVSTGNINASQYNFANGVNILSTVGAGAYGNTQVAEYLPTYSGNVRAEYVIMSFGGLITTGASPAPIISGFRSISTAGNAPNEGNITASGNLVASRGAYITGNVTAGNLTITGNLDQPNRGFGNGPGTNLYITAGHTQGCSIPGGNTIISGGLGYGGIAHNGGNVTLRTGDYYSKQWNFDYAGNLTLPAGGVIAEGGGISGAIKLTPAGGANANQALLIYPTGVAEGDHIHLTAGGGSTELYLGNDFHYVKLVDGGNIELRAATANLSSQAAWTFDTTGNIDTIQALGIKVPNGVPTNVAVINSTTGSWEMNPMSNLATTGGTGSGLTVNVAEVGGYASTIEIATAGTGYTNGDLITVTSGTSNATFTIVIGGRNSWRFGIDGNLTLPQTGYLKVGSGIVPAFISSPAPIITGFSNISAQNFTFLANGVNILSTVGAGSYGNAEVAAYLMTWPNADINILDTTSANITTLRAANFNSANAVISGGYISALTNASIITSTVVTQNITNGNVTTLRAANFNSANAVISGGYISALTNASIITSTVVTENITNGNITTLVATNFSTANAVISGGYIANTANITVALDGNISGVGNIIGSTANTTITAGAFTTSFLSNGVMITSTIIQTDAYYETYSNVTNTGGNITFNFANTTVFYATLTANVTANITNLANNLSTVTGFTVIIDQGATPYRIANIQFDGGTVTNIRWAGTTVPTGTASNTDIVSISLINLGNGSYRVLGQQSSYG